MYVAEDVGSDTVDSRFLPKRVFQTREAALEAARTAGKREVEKREIRSVVEEETKLPSTHRHGLGHQADDVAAGTDGVPTKVPGPENPEDRFS